MRKPLVVIGVAASALVLAGGVAAAAGAQETPQFPDVPGFSLPGLSGLPQFGDSGDNSGSADGSDTGDGSDLGWDSGGSDSDGLSDDSDSSGVDGSDSDPGAAAPAAQHHAAAPAAQHHPAAPAAQHHAAAHPARPRPAADRPDRRPGLGFAQRPAADNVIAASRESVTGADVSSSPSAPVQQQVLTLVNLNRRRGGCGDLSLDRRLIAAANEHAADMARHDYFAHESRDGVGAGDRVSEAGYQWRRYGENIARGVDSPYEVVDGWMHSPEHRHNILDCRLDQMGIGLAIAGDRTTYWVQDFATPQ